jgi:hypothetical protein
MQHSKNMKHNGKINLWSLHAYRSFDYQLFFTKHLTLTAHMEFLNFPLWRAGLEQRSLSERIGLGTNSKESSKEPAMVV